MALKKAAYSVSNTVNIAKDFISGTDKYASTQRSVRRQLLTMEEQSARLSKETASRNQSLAAAIAGGYREQNVAVAKGNQGGEDLQKVYANIESTSEKILKYWQQMAQMMAKMSGMSGGEMGLFCRSQRN